MKPAARYAVKKTDMWDLLPKFKTLTRYWKMTRDPRTPVAVRYLIYGGLAYTLMPFDIIPDWIPGLGLLDDAAIVPTLITLAMVLTPKEVKREYESHARHEIKRIKTEGKQQALEADVEAARKLKPYERKSPAAGGSASLR